MTKIASLRHQAIILKLNKYNPALSYHLEFGAIAAFIQFFQTEKTGVFFF